jgi:hypothetical protein
MKKIIVKMDDRIYKLLELKKLVAEESEIDLSISDKIVFGMIDTVIHNKSEMEMTFKNEELI